MSESDELRAKLRAQVDALRSKIDPRLLEQVRQAYLAQMRGEHQENSNAQKAVELYLQEKKKNAALLQQLARNLKGVKALPVAVPPPAAPVADPETAATAAADKPVVSTNELKRAISDFFGKISRNDRGKKAK